MKIDQYFKAIFDLSKVPTKFFVLVSLISGFYLFVDVKFFNEVSFRDAVLAKLGWIVGFSFFTSTALIIVSLFSWGVKKIREMILNKNQKRRILKILCSLDRFEQLVLCEFRVTKRNSLELPINNPTVSGLLNKKILVAHKQSITSYGVDGVLASVSINTLANEMLRGQHLGMSNPPTEDDVRLIESKRSDWKIENY
ncbi:super-infection exclusion protein B [Aquimarina intermedia]|uniref:Superinfection exclusion protein B n=1 Tax=Aquimarina intermedia TaxID=350814 RepID=A0A5S5BYS1_9FLAO|nr:super-infection exclusion protein B [Aquimarina intermedia]TYP71498.1 superinfection exclusion protein B [Aquimarina intermedia]